MGSGSTVLVIDDNVTICELICDLLAEENIECVGATGADEAVRKFLDHDIGLIVLDQRMPGVSGADLHRMLSEEFGAGKRTEGFSVRSLPPTIIITGAPEDEDVAKAALGESVVGVIAKPFDTGKLVRIIKKNLPQATS